MLTQKHHLCGIPACMEAAEYQTQDGKAFELLCDAHREALRQSNIAFLRDHLPLWHFEPYGTASVSIACYPPGLSGAQAYAALSDLAYIQSVCGVFYSVSQLKTP